MSRRALVLLLGAVVFLLTFLPTRAPAAVTEPARPPAIEPSYAPTTGSAGYFVKTAASLADVEKTLQGKGGRAATLLSPGPGPIEITWRHEEDVEQPELELHEGKDHVFFVTEGQATITLGGQLVAPHQISPGEWKAARSTHSQSVEVAKGDLLFIPHGTVHGRSVKGRRFTVLLLSFWPGGAPAPAPASPKAPAHP
jgi:mannose-6-phosphate isomerase-like protein (cupin superfamily)